MLRIVVPEREYYDERSNTFITTKRQELSLEHSLVSLAKWESKWEKPFISAANGNRDKTLTTEETIDYIRCMTLTQNVDPNIYNSLTDENYKAINEYISAPMTATWFSKNGRVKGRSRDIVTAEIIYYKMIVYGIPFECQKWHLNRLLTLIRVYEEMSAPAKKMSKSDIYRRNRELNEARKKALGTKG